MLLGEIVESSTPIRHCGPLWTRLSAPLRLLWLHAACLDGDMCIARWDALSNQERQALMLTLEDMVEFFRTVGELP
jgi:hypothetical protein